MDDPSMNRKQSIQIVGAGPGGLGAAITLARAGKTVDVHERYEVVGKRFQGDLQGIENWSTREDVLSLFTQAGLDLSQASVPFRSVTFTDGHRITFERNSSQPLFYLVKRGVAHDTLDQHLYRQAEQLGVRFHFRSSPPLQEADIVATGPLRKALVAADKGVTFRTSLPNMAVGIFHDELAYLGYSYLLISEGYGCVCTVVFREFHRLNSCFEKTLEVAKRYVKINLSEADSVGGVGSFSLHRTPFLEHALLVGEAAGLQDLLWGFGIRVALRSGQLAAEALLRSTSYEEAVQKHFHPFLKATLVGRFLWEVAKCRGRPLLPFMLALPLPLRFQFRQLYRYSCLHQFLYPKAEKYIGSRYPQGVNRDD